jgi:hypothetical protein
MAQRLPGCWLIVLLSVVVVGCASGRSDLQSRPHGIRAAEVGKPRTFLTTVARPAVYRHGSQPLYEKVIRYQVNALQLRSVRTGRVMAKLLRSLGDIDAIMTPMDRLSRSSTTAADRWCCASTHAPAGPR